MKTYQSGESYKSWKSKKTVKRITNSKRMDLFTVMSATLEDLKDQLRDRLSWKKSIYVVTKT